MKHIIIHSVPGFEEWREAARIFLNNYTHPSDIAWNTNETAQQSGLFDADIEPNIPRQRAKITVPKSFMPLAEAAICHSDPSKYDLLYRILWRINLENRRLLKLTTDNDIMRLTEFVKAVRKDAYKITAFLRFREIKHEGEEYFVAWYETEHYSLERVLPFFQTRFKNMKWSILTPYRAAHWNKEEMILEDNPDPSLYPKDDMIEKYWLGYYASIFNPARPKKNAMLNQMPKKYWKNMPETALVQDLLRGADARVKKMLAD